MCTWASSSKLVVLASTPDDCVPRSAGFGEDAWAGSGARPSGSSIKPPKSEESSPSSSAEAIFMGVPWPMASTSAACTCTFACFGLPVLASLSSLDMLPSLICSESTRPRRSCRGLSTRVNTSSLSSARVHDTFWKSSFSNSLCSTNCWASPTGNQKRMRSEASVHATDSCNKRIAKKRVRRLLPSLETLLYHPKSNKISHSTPASSIVSRRAHASKDPPSTSSSNFPAGTVYEQGFFLRDTSKTSNGASAPRPSEATCRNTTPPARRIGTASSPPPPSMLAVCASKCTTVIANSDVSKVRKLRQMRFAA
mmetsp:Transcript_41244/g.105008  ORF Transcript_41244/g.105008 Transcript_41244/m.105008 type:complete len:310 (-) Transcript_41244:26-955(-)